MAHETASSAHRHAVARYIRCYRHAPLAELRPMAYRVTLECALMAPETEDSPRYRDRTALRAALHTILDHTIRPTRRGEDND